MSTKSLNRRERSLLSLGDTRHDMESGSITPKSQKNTASEPKEYGKSSADSENRRRARQSTQAFCGGLSGESPLPLPTEQSAEEVFPDVEFGDYPSTPISRPVEGLTPSSGDWEGFGNLDEKLYQEDWNIPFLGPMETSISQGPDNDHKNSHPFTYLFVTCLECPSMIMIKSPGKLLPGCWTGPQSQYENGVILTTCKTCERPCRKNTLPIYGALRSDLIECQAHQHLGAHLFEGSDLLKIPKVILGKDVHMIVDNKRVKYMTREEITGNLRDVDMVTSLDMSGVDSGDPDTIFLPYLRGNYI